MKPAMHVDHGGGKEIVSLRRGNAKVFLMPDGTFRTCAFVGPDGSELPYGFLHYRDKDGVWQERDHSLVDNGDHWGVAAAPYKVRIAKTGLRVEFTGLTKSASLELPGANDPVALDANEHDGKALAWTGDGYRCELYFLPHGVRVQTVLNRPVRLPWKREGFNAPIAVDAKGRRCEMDGDLPTGRVLIVADPQTRKRTWVDGIEYPVTIR